MKKKKIKKQRKIKINQGPKQKNNQMKTNSEFRRNQKPKGVCSTKFEKVD